MEPCKVYPGSDGERGMVIIGILLIAILLGSLAMAAVEEGLGERAAVKHQVGNVLALEICEVGLVKSELEIATNTDNDGGGIGNVSGEVNGGSYSVVAEKVPNMLGRWVLVGRGEYEHSVRRVEVGLKVRGGLFSYALFGKDLVQIEGGSTTDSYDSRAGTWAAQAVNPGAFPVPYAKTNGTIGSNLDVLVNNNTAVRGGAHPGPTGSFGGNAGNVWDGVSNLPEPTDLPLPPLDEFLEAMKFNGNGKIDGTQHGVTYDPVTYKLKLDAGQTLTLDGGTYFFTELVAEGNGKLVVTAATTLYVTGRLSFKGGLLANATGQPSDLVIHSHPYDIVPGYDPSVGGTIVMEGDENAAYALYAPERPVSLAGSSHTFGAVVGKTVNLRGGSSFHYDEALADWGYANGALGTRIYWVELGTHND